MPAFCRSCLAAGSRVQASFNYADQRGARFCSKHKSDGMIDVVHQRCEHEGCDSITPTYDYPEKKGNKKGRFCRLHKLQGMVQVKNPMCATCKTFNVQRTTDVCASCRLGSARIKKFEASVKAELEKDEVLKHYTVHDTALTCRARDMPQKERPDFVWVVEHGALILEVDEHAHRFYEASCENARLTRLADALATAVTVVRYNPNTSWARLGKRKRGDADDHSFLIQILHTLLKQESLPKDDTVCENGNEGLRVVYIGYKEADVRGWE